MEKIGLLVMPLMAISFLVSCGNKKSLEKCSWKEIDKISQSGKAENHFKVGDEKIVTINNQPHKARIIGFNHDVDKNSKKIGITFEFANLISDENGYSLATPWNWDKDESSTNDYLNSNLRKAIDGGGTATSIWWYQKGSETKSTTYKSSVLDMLPDDLKNVLKEAKKPIINSNEETSYNTKLFPLSYCEMTEVSPEDAGKEGTTYAFYKGEGDTNPNRVKWQIKHHEGALTHQPPFIKDRQSISKDIGNWAGYNSKKDVEELETGGFYSLRSPKLIPSTNDNPYAWRVMQDGELKVSTQEVYESVYAVAPAFCI